MRQQAADLAVQNPDQLRTARHGDAEQLFRRQTKRVLLIHRRDVIEPVEIRDRLQIGFVLDQLFGAAMKQADVRIDALDHFAVEFQHQTQHAVRSRMLRAEIDGEVAEVVFGHRLALRALANGEWRIANGIISQPCPAATVSKHEAFCPSSRTEREPVANPAPAEYRRAPPKADAFPALSESPARFADAARSCRYFPARDLPQCWPEPTPLPA